MRHDRDIVCELESFEANYKHRKPEHLVPQPLHLGRRPPHVASQVVDINERECAIVQDLEYPEQEQSTHGKDVKNIEPASVNEVMFHPECD